MKQLILNRKLKQQLAEHFSRGGSAHDVKGDLLRVSFADRQSCHDYHKRMTARTGVTLQPHDSDDHTP